MLTDEQKAFLDKATAAAQQSTHPFPRMAAAEAALESAYGKSALAVDDNNLFGMKQHRHPLYETASLPTREFIKGGWVETTADWVKYPDWSTCFFDRLATLTKLSGVYPDYAAALRASDVQTYIAAVSHTWSTDPQRSAKCIAIYNAYLVAEPQAPQGAD